eukprot:2823316-Amphidinium_carterae.2
MPTATSVSARYLIAQLRCARRMESPIQANGYALVVQVKGANPPESKPEQLWHSDVFLQQLFLGF